MARKKEAWELQWDHERQEQQVAFHDARHAAQRERSAVLSYSEPCHQACLEAQVIRMLTEDERRIEMLREHFRRRVEYRVVELPRQQAHRRRYAQQYGRDPLIHNDRKYPGDDYACRFSEFTSDGAEQIRIREGMIRTGQVDLPCLERADERMAP